ncbi:MAG: N-acyl homoserine lactone hydrolase [Actinomycetota bacterium]|jgi:glyoxylase-like metal-dependent hydrolase (beta-lactamase superfamily II)
MASPALEDVLPLHLSTVVFPDWHPLSGQTGDVLGFAIRHSRGIVLFDTGIGIGNGLIDELYAPSSNDLVDALAAHGHAVRDVTTIVNSHLHFDHCGNNHLFPGVPIYAQEGELVEARTPMYTVPEWIDFDGAEYRPIDGDETIGPGMRIVATPGHTGGHQSLVLDTNDGPLVLSGQAIYSRAECEHIREHDDLPAGDPAPDPAQYLSSARLLLGMRPRRVHFSHDRAIWDDPSQPLS